MENSLPPKETNNLFFFFLQPLNLHGEGVQDVGAARGRCPRRSLVAGVVMWGDKEDKQEVAGQNCVYLRV